MSVSYGTITITDTTDLGQLSVYLTGSTVRQQVYDSNTNPVSFYPNWDRTNGTPLLITPHIYFNGQSKLLTDNNIIVSWQKIENGNTYNLPVSPTTEDCPESVNDKVLERPTNLSINSVGATYTATITYYPIDGDLNTTLTAIATLDLTIANNGIKGDNGAPAKMLQLIGDGSYFTYHYDGSFFGAQTITLTAQKSTPVYGIHWYCKKASSNTYIPIKVINGSPSTDTTATGWSSSSYYTTMSLTFAGQSVQNQLDILDLIPDFITDRGAQFKIVEIDSNGNEVTNGLVDYLSIYALVEAAPGQDTYSSYLSNDEETIIDINGSPILDNAQTQIFISQAGADDLENWHISVTDSISTAADFVYTLSNSKDIGSSTTYLNKYGPDRVQVTAMNVNAALITFTAVHGSYSGNTFISDADNTSIPASEKISNIVKTFSLAKSAAIVSHSLRLDTVNANKATNNSAVTYLPSQVVIDAITRMAGGTSEYRDAGVISAIIHLTGGELYNFGTLSNPIYYTSNANGQPLTLTLASYGDIEYIDTYLGGAYNSTTNVFDSAEDKQKITISSDGTNGSDGTSPWSFLLSNQFDGISTDFTYVSSTAFTIDLPIQAAQGATAKTIHYGGSNYPTITAPTILSTIAPVYYNGNKAVSTSGSRVTSVRYVIPKNTNIGATGSITLTLTYASGQTLTQTYTYKAQPEALKPIRIALEPSPSNTFENQEGIITITPTVLTGTTSIDAGYWSSPTWEAYTEVNNQMRWVQITSTTASDAIHLSGNSLVVKGSAVEGYLGLRFTVSVSRGGIIESNTEYINLTDIDDPLQVTLHSTVGERIVNGQGVGVIYARVVRRGDSEDYDTVAPDNLLGIGTIVPTGNINTGVFAGKTGYCLIVTSGNPATPTGEIRYYWRTATDANWTGYRGMSGKEYRYKYTWVFRDSNNQSYIVDDSNTPVALNYAMNISNNTQFVYVDAGVIDNKVTAVVKVEL